MKNYLMKKIFVNFKHETRKQITVKIKRIRENEIVGKQAEKENMKHRIILEFFYIKKMTLIEQTYRRICGK